MSQWEKERRVKTNIKQSERNPKSERIRSNKQELCQQHQACESLSIRDFLFILTHQGKPYNLQLYFDNN